MLSVEAVVLSDEVIAAPTVLVAAQQRKTVPYCSGPEGALIKL